MTLAILLVLAASLLGGWARHSVQKHYRDNQQVPNQAGMSGAEVAEALLRAQGLAEVPVERVEGFLSDHYDPRAKVLRLSAQVYDGRDLSALGIAAHEAGHALQQAHRYAPLTLRNFTVPSAQLGNLLGIPLLLLGAVLHNPLLAIVGLLFYLGVVLFQLITLPVELDASRRALASLDDLRLLRTEQEVQGVTAVLNAAALTYVAAALAGLSMLLYYALMIFGGRRN
ncbi:MAG: zinc metallopeptidase [Planctomycetota bacterium]